MRHPHLMACFLLVVAAALTSCKATYTSAEVVHVVGEIFPDHAIDDPEFQLCHDQEYVIQYYAFNEKTYLGEKAAILEYFEQNYVAIQNKESGIIRIRFIINCQGQAGRYRMLAMDTNYQPTTFSTQITDQLLQLTQNLKGWKSMEANGVFRDYYQYLLFKIENGALIEILP